jgi:hypothetical protein
VRPMGRGSWLEKTTRSVEDGIPTPRGCDFFEGRVDFG